jgi:2-dehydro-3-deoxyphosphooctonate aldolase (KDO 8-P synthase)
VTVAQFDVGPVRFGGPRLVLIAGPCVIESREACLRHADKLGAIARHAGVPLVFKSSFDKANRTSHESYRGPGLETGLRILEQIKAGTGLPVLTDVHEPAQARVCAEVVDILQIPALLSRQTDLIQAVAATGRAVNLKKGQFLAPWDMRAVVRKVEAAGNRRILVTERGFSFGYNNLVSDLRSLVIMREFGYPVSASLSSRWRAPRWRPESTQFSWKCMKIRNAPSATAPIPFPSRGLPTCSNSSRELMS